MTALDDFKTASLVRRGLRPEVATVGWNMAKAIAAVISWWEAWPEERA